MEDSPATLADLGPSASSPAAPTAPLLDTAPEDLDIPQILGKTMDLALIPNVGTHSCSKNKRRREKNRKTDQEIIRNPSLPSVFP